MSKDQKRLDNYKPLKFFQDNAPKTNTGFAKFEDGNAYYFCYFFGGKIVLLSESYTGEPGRDNGIESVKKNMKLEERYRFHEHENGKHYFDLIAGNYQEIATSVWFGSEKAAKEMANILAGNRQSGEREIDDYHPLAFFESRISGVQDGFDTFEAEDGHYFTYNRDGKIVLISEAYTSTAGRDNGIESVRKNMKIDERYDYRALKNGQHDYRIKAGNNQEIARSVWYGSAAAATAGAAYLIGKKTDREVDDYHPLAFYESRISGVEEGFDSFEAEDGYYFTYNQEGKPVLLSEAYVSTAGRNNGIESVRKNMVIEERYDYRALKNGKHDFKIKAGNNQEVARSVWFGSAAAATAAAAILMGKRKKAIPIAPVASAPVAATSVVAPPAYVSPTPTAAAAATPVAAVAASPGMWGWLRWLLFALLALLALFLLSKCFAGGPKVPPVVYVTCSDGSQAETQDACPVVANYDCWDGSKVLNAAACPIDTRYTCWDGSKVTNEAACPTDTRYTCWDGSQAENEAACPIEPTYTCWDGSKAVDAAACPVKPNTEVTCWNGSKAKDQASCPVRPVNYPTDFSCTCVGSNAAIFNIPEGVSPKSIGLLGTLPEFGSLRGLTPDQFYYKLSQRYEQDSFDRQYLDYIFRSMGFTNGFSDATSADFSEETFAYGVSGLLGFGDSHHYAYSQLNVSDPNDLQSFKITARNGCDVNFMKTCGNYMYVCE